MRNLNRLLLALLCLWPSLTACEVVGGMRKLRGELDELENHLRLVTGNVANVSGRPGKVIALLLIPDHEAPGSLAVSAYKTLQNEGEKFVFSLEGRGSKLVAFLDVDGDYRHQEGEPIHVLAGEPISTHFTLDQSQWVLNRLELSGEDVSSPGFALEIGGETVSTMLPFSRYIGTSNIGRLVAFDDPNFSSDKVFMGLWEPLRFAREVGYGFYLLEPWSAERDILLMIHGLHDSPRVWRDLVPQLDLTNHQVVLFHYPSGLSLEKSARILSDAISEMHLRSQGRRVRIVGHSVGGLIARRYIQLQEDRGFADESLDRFLAISTPWGGMNSARQGVENSPVVVPVWRDIATNSEFLRALHDRPLPEGVEFTLLFSYAEHRENQPVANDGTVSLKSQLDYRAQNLADHLHGLDEGHLTIVSSPCTAEFINRYLLAD